MRQGPEFLAIAGFLATSLSCSSPDSGEIPLSKSVQPVIGGDSDAEHAYIVSVMTTPEASIPELCTGTLIGPRAVLTAGHCTLGQTADSLQVGVGASAKNPERTLAVESVVTYPGFSGSQEDVEAGLDLGLLILGEDAAIDVPSLDRSGDEAAVGQNWFLWGSGSRWRTTWKRGELAGALRSR